MNCHHRLQEAIHAAQTEHLNSSFTSAAASSSSNFWRTIQYTALSKPTSHTPALQTACGVVSSPQDIANTLISNFQLTPTLTPTIPFDAHQLAAINHFISNNAREFRQPQQSLEPYNLPFSTQALLHVIHRNPSNTAGPDNIPHWLLKYGGEPLFQLLLKLINLSWTSHVLPSTWKSAYIVLILKQGKLSSKPTSYRPIALLNSQSKLAYRIVYNRLYYVCDS